jgi:hypothetical protein
MATGEKDSDREAELEAALETDPQRGMEARPDIAEAAPRYCADTAKPEASPMMKGLEMRKLLALMVLVCGVASADAAETKKWCSDGYGNDPAVFVFSDDGPEIRIKGRLVERLDREFWHEHVIFANIDY